MRRKIDTYVGGAVCRWLTAPIALTVTLVVLVVLAPALAGAASTRIRNGLYAPKANNKTPYANGVVDLIVYGSGRKLNPTQSGLACYTGTTPPPGVPTNDEVSIRFPHALTISATNQFSFSGPVTISAADAQSTQPINTTFRLNGRFVAGKGGTFTATGTASSPVCQASTPRHFTSPYAGP